MKLAIMQPYFLPYIGYFQLIAAVDRFVIYDNIKYTKKGWINRNRMLRDGTDVMFSLPLKGGSDNLDIVERQLSADFDRRKLLAQFHGAYRRAPCFSQAFPVVEEILGHDEDNLFAFIHHSVVRICRYLEIPTEVVVSSTIPIDHGLKGEEKVLALCRQAGADTYVNAIGGIDLYSPETFRLNGIELRFIRSRRIEYTQFGQAFVPWLSILDLIMFNTRDALKEQIDHGYDLI